MQTRQKFRFLFVILLLSTSVFILDFDFSDPFPTFKLKDHVIAKAGYVFKALRLENGVVEDGTFRPRAICNCSTPGSVYFGFGASLTKLNSTCSPESAEVGPGQHVISYSISSEGQHSSYVRDIKDILALTKILYPEWVVRFYGNLNETESLCDVICGSPDSFFFCPIQFMDGFAQEKVSKRESKLWRFLPLGDGTVSRVITRDLDNRPGQRERDSVLDWENSDYAFHAMRDDPINGALISPGLWGAANQLLSPAQALALRESILNFKKRGMGDTAKLALKQLVYEPYQKTQSILIHDSFHCERYKDGAPFPTQRKDPLEFVGKSVRMEMENVKVPECPLQCRPKTCQHWTYC